MAVSVEGGRHKQMCFHVNCHSSIPELFGCFGLSALRAGFDQPKVVEVPLDMVAKVDQPMNQRTSDEM
jgi:hypothetical protein